MMKSQKLLDSGSVATKSFHLLQRLHCIYEINTKVIWCNIGRMREGTCNESGLVKLISGEERIKPLWINVYTRSV
jgi:hypothetical protein